MMVTSASRPIAMRAALVPTTPPPSTTHLGRRHAGHAAEQHAAAALRDLQAMRAGLDGHASGHFAHRRQQRQTAARIRHRLIGDADGAGVRQGFGLLADRARDADR